MVSRMVSGTKAAAALITAIIISCYTARTHADGPTLSESEGQSAKRVLAPEHRRVMFELSAFHRVSPRWDKGYLLTRNVDVTHAASKAVTLYDSTGNKVREVGLWPEGAIRVLIRSAAVTPDGRIVVAAGVDKTDGTSTSILAISDASGKVVKTIPTSPYVPSSVCVTPEGAVWTFGWSGWEHQNAPTLRRFDFQRGQVAAYLPLSIFRGAERNPTASLYMGRFLAFTCASDRVAIYSETGGEYIEVEYSTETPRRWKIGDSGDGLTLAGPWMAVTSAGDVFAVRGSPSSRAGELRGLFYLERDERSGTVHWRPVQGQVSTAQDPSGVLGLLGADGDALVYISQLDYPAVKWARPRAE
jgi:hypothetical protein